MEQLKLICESTDISEEDVAEVCHPACSESVCKLTLHQDPSFCVPTNAHGAQRLRELLEREEVEEDLIDLILNMLVFNPRKRIGVSTALQHRVFAELSCLHDEPSCPHPFHIEDEMDDFSLVQCQEMLKTRANELASWDSCGAASNDELSVSSFSSSFFGSQ